MECLGTDPSTAQYLLKADQARLGRAGGHAGGAHQPEDSSTHICSLVLFGHTHWSVFLIPVLSPSFAHPHSDTPRRSRELHRDILPPSGEHPKRSSSRERCFAKGNEPSHGKFISASAHEELHLKPGFQFSPRTNSDQPVLTDPALCGLASARQPI